MDRNQTTQMGPKAAETRPVLLKLWDRGGLEDAVVAVVLDTGVNATHADLAALGLDCLQYIESALERLRSRGAASAALDVEIGRSTHAHLLLIVRGVGDQVQLENGNGRTSNREPYQRLFLPDGVLMPGQSITTRLLFRQQPQLPSLSYGLTVLSGQGTP